MVQNINYNQTNYFSSLICDYLDEKEKVQSLYGQFPSIEAFEKQIHEKAKSYTSEVRKVLRASLEQQYQGFELSAKTRNNIESLSAENTFTITTGHQLNLFTGPLYFLYKILAAINLAESLKQKYPKYHFVPVYWMASEDHDFDEINFFNYQGKKIQWNEEASGAVGRLSTAGLYDVYDVFSKQLGASANAEYIRALFKEGYLQHKSLSEATRYIANELFKAYGLVIIDGDHEALKKCFVPYVKKELLTQLSYNEVSRTNTLLNELHYKVQVNPREINLFYLKENNRERITVANGEFKIKNTAISFTQEEILEELEAHPQRFSPNALLRPLYQEVILPNLCYIGGGGELAYWFQLKSYFDKVEVAFPILLLRNSLLLLSENQKNKIQKLDLNIQDLFLEQEVLKSKRIHDISAIDINFSAQKTHLKKQFLALYELAEKTDRSFKGAVSAQERKQIKGLEHLEKRLLKAQKRSLADQLERITMLQDVLFPNHTLQERKLNFSEFYLEHGQDLMDKLKETIEPLDLRFKVVTL